MNVTAPANFRRGPAAGRIDPGELCVRLGRLRFVWQLRVVLDESLHVTALDLLILPFPRLGKVEDAPRHSVLRVFAATHHVAVLVDRDNRSFACALICWHALRKTWVTG
jgi:hypothetical protein